jgi:uncharacterized membrane protein
VDAPALSDSAAIPDARPVGPGWRGLALRAEDWLLAGWVVLAAPLLAVAGGEAGPFDSGHPLTGLLLLTGFAGAIACLATRSSDTSAEPTAMALPDTPSGSDTETAGPSPARWSILDSGAVGPLVGGLLLVGGTAFAEFGLDPLTAFYPTIAAVLVLSVVQSHLPAVPTAVRRALVTPYLLSAGGIFWTIVHAVTAGMDLRGQFGTSLTGVSSGVATVLGILTLCAAVYYAMLIYAPRQIAEREGGAIMWLARFALFLVSVILGLGWLSLLGG